MENKKNSSGEQLKYNLDYLIRRTHWDDRYRIISDEITEECMQKINNLILNKFKANRTDEIYIKVEEIEKVFLTTSLTSTVIKAILENEVINKNRNQRTININDFYESINQEYLKEKDIKNQNKEKLENLNKILFELKKLSQIKKEEERRSPWQYNPDALLYLNDGRFLINQLFYIIEETYYFDHHGKCISKKELENCFQAFNKLILKRYLKDKENDIYLSVDEIGREINRTGITGAVEDEINCHKGLRKLSEGRHIKFDKFFKEIKEEYLYEIEKPQEEQNKIKIDSFKYIINKINNIKVLLIQHYKKENIDLSSIELEEILEIIKNKYKTFNIDGKSITITKEEIESIINEYNEELVNKYINKYFEEKAKKECSINKINIKK